MKTSVVLDLFLQKEWKIFEKSYMQSALGLNIFYLYTLYIEQHIKTYNNIQFTNEIQKKVRLLDQLAVYALIHTLHEFSV